MEERIYFGGLPDGYCTPPEIGQTIAIINNLLKKYFTHEHGIKPFVYNDGTYQILMIFEVIHGCRDCNEQIAELNSLANDSSHLN